MMSRAPAGMTRIAAAVNEMYVRLKDKMETLMVTRNGLLYRIKAIRTKEKRL